MEECLLDALNLLTELTAEFLAFHGLLDEFSVSCGLLNKLLDELLIRLFLSVNWLQWLPVNWLQ